MKFRYLLPFDHFKLQTNLTVEEVKAKLADNIEPRKAFRFSLFRVKATRPYEGKILGNTFQIRRIINYNNSFQPLIKGEISRYLNRTEVLIKMRPASVGLFFMCLWLGIVGLLCIWALISAFRRFDQESITVMFLPLIMFVFGFGFTTFGYRTEAEKSKTFFRELLEVKE